MREKEGDASPPSEKAKQSVMAYQEPFPSKVS